MPGLKVNIDVRKVLDNGPQLRAALTQLVKREVLVGYPEAKNKPRKEGSVTNAFLAYIQDRGSPANNIPSRQFLVPGVRSAQDAMVKQLRRGARLALQEGPSAVDKALEGVGLEAVSGIRNYMTKGIPPPLKASTLRARKKAGFAGTKPLIRTGQLRNAATYVVRNKPNAKTTRGI